VHSSVWIISGWYWTLYNVHTCTYIMSNHRLENVHRLEISTFSRAFNHEGIFGPAYWWRGCICATPFTLQCNYPYYSNSSAPSPSKPVATCPLEYCPSPILSDLYLGIKLDTKEHGIQPARLFLTVRGIWRWMVRHTWNLKPKGNCGLWKYKTAEVGVDTCK
jgi:hypothetical protein